MLYMVQEHNVTIAITVWIGDDKEVIFWLDTFSNLDLFGETEIFKKKEGFVK